MTRGGGDEHIGGGGGAENLQIPESGTLKKIRVGLCRFVYFQTDRRGGRGGS